MAGQMKEEIELELSFAPSDLKDAIAHFRGMINQKTELRRKFEFRGGKETALFQQELLRCDRESYDFLALPLEEQLVQREEDWPYLSTCLGTDYKDGNGNHIETLVEAAELIDMKSKEIDALLVQTRRERKEAIRKVEKSRTREEAALTYLEFLPNHTRKLRP